MSMLADQVDVVVGVDTHRDTHVAAAVTAVTGAVLAEITIPATTAGYDRLIDFAGTHAGPRAWAIEGTCSYGAGLTRHLHDAAEWVIEVERPKRPTRRGGKSDAIDAIRSARDALAMEHLAQPRTGKIRAALAATCVARNSAVTASSDAQRQLHALIVTAPEPLRNRFRDQTTTTKIATAARLCPHRYPDPDPHHTAAALKALARRIQALNTEAKNHEATLDHLVRSWRPDLLELTGIGPITAATILCAWSHPGRCRNDGAFATLTGVAPLDASSGLHQQHRFNPGGDRDLNQALHIITLCRLRHDPRTRAYAQRRRTDPNMTDRKIRRCLKRYIAREIYRLLENGTPPTT